MMAAAGVKKKKVAYFMGKKRRLFHEWEQEVSATVWRAPFSRAHLQGDLLPFFSFSFSFFYFTLDI
jgi:hypothetical protein